MKNKFLFGVLSILGCSILVGTSSFAASYSDTEEHWAKDAIERWTDYSIVQGYGDKTFKPNGEMTRAELSQVISKLLELKNKKGSNFSDVNSERWYYEAISACNNANIVEGKGDNVFAPEDKVTREEAIVMIGRALGIESDEKLDAKNFKDTEDVSEWAEGILSKMISEEVVNGVTKDELKPKANVSRAQVLTILNRAISNYISKDGTYEIKEGRTLITAENATIKGVADNDIVIVQGAENSNIKLEDIKAEGNLLIKAEGAKVELLNETEIKEIDVLADEVTLEVDEKAKAEHIEVEAFKLEANIEGQVESIDVTEKAKDTKIAGAGKVSDVNVRSGAENTTVETKKTHVNTEEGSNGTIAGGKEVTPGKDVVTSSGSSEGQGGGSTSDVKVSKVTVSAEALNGDINMADGIAVFENYTAEAKINLSAQVEPENATNKEVKFEVDKEDMASLENGVLTLKKTGTLTIKAIAQDGSEVFGTLTLRVAPEFELNLTKEEISEKLTKFESDYYNKEAGTKLFPEVDNSNWFFEAKSVLPLGEEDKALGTIKIEEKEVENAVSVSIGKNNMLNADMFKLVEDNLQVGLPIVLLENGEIKIGDGNLKMNKSEIKELKVESLTGAKDIDVQVNSEEWTIEFDKKFVKENWEHYIGMKLANITDEAFDMNAHNYFTKKVKSLNGVENISYGFTSVETAGSMSGLIAFYPALEENDYTIEYTIVSIGDEMGIAKTMLNIGANGGGLLPKFEETVVDNSKLMEMLQKFNETFYNKPYTGKKNYFDLTNDKELTNDNWFIKVNTKEAFKEIDKITKLTVNGLEFNKNETQDISVGNSNFIKATMWKFDEDGYLQLGLPIVVLESTDESNKIEYTLTYDDGRIVKFTVTMPEKTALTALEIVSANSEDSHVEVISKGDNVYDVKIKTNYCEGGTLNIKDMIKIKLSGEGFDGTNYTNKNIGFFTKRVKQDDNSILGYGFTDAESDGTLGAYPKIEGVNTLIYTITTADGNFGNAVVTINIIIEE